MPVQLRRLATLLPRINPDVPFSANRRVDAKHGADFGDYIESNADTWVEPGILLVTKRELDFTRKFGMQLPPAPYADQTPVLEVGYLKLDAAEAQFELEISDGQHRTLATQQKNAWIKKELTELESEKASLLSSDKHKYELRLNHVLDLMQRFNMETMNLTIISQVPVDLQSRWFLDINDKAKQVKKAEAIRLDEHTNTAVCTKSIIAQHPLFDGLIGLNTEKPAKRILDRENSASAASPAIFAIPNIEDFVKNIAYSFNKRETKQQTSEKLQQVITQNSIVFFDTLVSEVPEFKKLIDDVDYTGKEFRKDTLYSSAPFVRALADVFHQIALQEVAVIIDSEPIKAHEVDISGLAGFKKLLQNLAPYMKYEEISSGVGKKSKYQVKEIWYETLLFRPGSKAPGSAFQELNGLSKLLCHWARTEKVFSPKTVKELDSITKGGI